MSVTIAIDLTAIYDHLSGIERYNINITRELIRQHPDEEYILFFKNEVHASFRKEVDKPNVKYVILPECHKLLFIQWRLFRALQKTDADYYIFLCFSSPVLFKKGRIINAIHDLTFWDCPECIPVKMKYYYRMTAGISVKRSWRIIAVSRFSQKRVCEHYGLPLEKVPVIYDGLTDIFKKAPVADPNLKFKYNLPERYVLSLSTIEPRKNLQLLIRAYKELVEEGKNLPNLVLAGREGWKLEDIVGDISEEVKNRIHFTGFIDDEDLPQIYREAELFVFPSKYEGFGLPIIEAMSQGTPVLSSDAASLPEITGRYGKLFESDNCADLKRELEVVLTSASMTDEKSRKEAVEWARGFDWGVEAEKLYQILKEG